MVSDTPDVRRLSIFDEEPVKVAGGTLDWIPLRRRLGIAAFGTNAYRAAHAGDVVIEEHVESPGQEELYVVLAGSARIVVGDQSFDCPTGTALFVARPELSRSATALEDDTAVLGVGGWPDRAYHPLPWEPLYLAQESIRNGDWESAAATLEREAGVHRETPIIRYRLACCYARLGDQDRALSELAEAIAGNSAFKEKAAGEEHFETLREVAGWSDLVA